jgi:hypothetical protein
MIHVSDSPVQTINGKYNPTEKFTDAGHKKYIEILRSMIPEQKPLCVFDLTDFIDRLFRFGLWQRSPELPEEEFEKLYRERLDKCHKRNWQNGLIMNIWRKMLI